MNPVVQVEEAVKMNLNMATSQSKVNMATMHRLTLGPGISDDSASVRPAESGSGGCDGAGTPA